MFLKQFDSAKKIFLLIFAWAATAIGLLSYKVSIAGENSYFCTITQVHSIEKSTGTLKPVALSSIDTSDFSVDRVSGRSIARSGSGLTDDYAYERNVVDKGGHDKPFERFSLFSGWGSQYIRIYEHYDGPIKPFLLVHLSYVASGTCK